MLEQKLLKTYGRIACNILVDAEPKIAEIAVEYLRVP